MLQEYHHQYSSYHSSTSSSHSYSSTTTSPKNIRTKMRLNKAFKIVSPQKESYISPPYFPMRPHSKIGPISPPTMPRRTSSSSTSSNLSISGASITSIASTASTMTEAEQTSGEHDLKRRAMDIMTTLSSPSSTRQSSEDVLSSLIAKNVTVSHDDSPSCPPITLPIGNDKRAEIFDRWDRIRSFHYESRVIEALVDQTQRKVLVRSEMKLADQDGGQEWVKERVDMMTFDYEGRLCSTADWYRKRRAELVRDDEEDEFEE